MASTKLIRAYEGAQLAEDYYKYRPTYPAYIRDTILKYINAERNGKKKQGLRMLDVGCGSGQATHMFADHFESILGIDISENQIKVAKKYNENENVEFQLVHDNIFPSENDSLDLVNCATAVHYLNLENFESECNRVLKPGGIAAVYIFRMCGIKSCTEPEIVLHSEFDDMLVKYLEDCGVHVPNYRVLFDQIKNPAKEWIECPQCDIEYTLPIHKKLESTIGEYHTYMETNPAADPLEVFCNSIKKALHVENVNDDEVKFKVIFDYYFFIFRKQK